MNLQDRVFYVRRSVSEMRLPKSGAAYRLMAEKVPLDWNMACDAAEEIMRLHELLKATRHQVRMMQMELRKKWK